MANSNKSKTYRSNVFMDRDTFTTVASAGSNQGIGIQEYVTDCFETEHIRRCENSDNMLQSLYYLKCKTREKMVGRNMLKENVYNYILASSQESDTGDDIAEWRKQIDKFCTHLGTTFDEVSNGIFGSVEPTTASDTTAIGEACNWLHYIMTPGVPYAAKDIDQQAKENNISEWAMRAAKQRLNIKSIRKPLGYVWVLPEPEVEQIDADAP